MFHTSINNVIILILINSTCATLLFSVIFFSFSASRWKDASSGQHVDYDQRPDIFRYVNLIFMIFYSQFLCTEFTAMAGVQ